MTIIDLQAQFSFTQGRCTEDALILFVSNLYEEFNARNKSTGLLVDFRQSFDPVHHSILLEKL